MKNQKMFFLGCLVFAVMFGAGGMAHGAKKQSRPEMAPPDKPGEASLLKTEKDQVSYAIGVNLIGNFKKQRVDVDLNMVMKGMQDAFAGEKLLMSEDELGRAIKLYYSEVRQAQTKNIAMTAEENLKEGEAFLAENAKKDGVVTLPSGLQYKIIQDADGKKPAAEDTVEVHYRGTLINGREFDSSYRTGRPAIFKVNGVIPGWQEAFQRMPVGATWQIFVPSPLAYGEKGAGSFIGPNATLVFEVKLLAIK